MPSTLPGVSPAQAAFLLQNTDKLIKTIPEVDTVFGKVGKAETATDSAPMEMIETTIRLKPQAQWREGMTLEKLLMSSMKLYVYLGLQTYGFHLFVTVLICYLRESKAL